MSEYFVHRLVKDFVSYWISDASAEEYLQKLLQYQERYCDRNVITGPEQFQTVANRSSNAVRFIEKYEHLDSGKTDLLPKYMVFLSLLQNHKGLIEEFKEKFDEMSKKVSKNESSTNETIDSIEDVEKIFVQLQHVAKEVEERKTKNATISERKDGLQKTKKQICVDLNLWKIFRPFMSADFSNNILIGGPLPIGAVPRSSQEKYLVKDTLQCLLGFHGKYINGIHADDKETVRSFALETSVYAPYRSIILEILVLAEYYSVVIRFIEEHNQFASGRVNQALCAVLEDLLQDYRVFIIQLEMKHRKELLSLQSLLYNIQTYLETMSYLSRIVHAVNKAEARGGRTLSLLHDAGKHNAIQQKIADLLVSLIRRASVPYFEMLELWIHTGYVHDPCDEFMIEDNSEIENQNTLSKGECSNEYWKKRYRIKKDHVPTFLQQYQQKILRTGKYLNTIKQCKNFSASETNEMQIKKPVSARMCYTSLNSHEFTDTIDSAYNFASDTLLNLLMNEYDILNRLKSLKRYFLIEQGDFLSVMMDLCEEELSKPVNEILPSRLNSLIEFAIRTCSSSKIDPYKNDIYIDTGSEELALQVFRINSINTAHEKEYRKKNPEKILTSLDVVILRLKTAWPVSLMFNEKVMGCYQMLFRLLLHCKYVERILCKVWICDQQIKKLEKHYRKHYLRAFLLRRKMLLFIQNISYYMTNEVIEQHWYTFLSVIKMSQNIDDVMKHHWEYLNNCMNDCMLTSSRLIKPLTWLLKNCTEFCNFIQDMRIYLDAEFTSMLSPNDYLDYTVSHFSLTNCSNQSKKNSSFEERIKIFESEFNNNLGILLKLIPLSEFDECSSQLSHFLNRQNFNGYYTSLIGSPTSESEKTN